jgi:predicted component of type VI protein secretion system
MSYTYNIVNIDEQLSVKGDSQLDIVQITNTLDVSGAAVFDQTLSVKTLDAGDVVINGSGTPGINVGDNSGNSVNISPEFILLPKNPTLNTHAVHKLYIDTLLNDKADLVNGIVPPNQLPFDGLTFQGTWDASSNTPEITSGLGDTGDYYIISTNGTTNIDGEINWNIGDWIIFTSDAQGWVKIDNTNTDISFLSNQVSQNETRLNDLDVSMNAVENDISTHETRLNDLDVSMNAVENDISTHETRLDNLDVSMNAVEGDVSTHETRLDNLDVSMNAVEGDVSTHETRLDNLDVSMNAVEGDVSTHETRLNGLDVSMNVVEGDVSTHETRLDDLDVSMNLVEGDVSTHETRLNGLDVSMNAVEGDIVQNILDISTNADAIAVITLAINGFSGESSNFQGTFDTMNIACDGGTGACFIESKIVIYDASNSTLVAGYNVRALYKNTGTVIELVGGIGAEEIFSALEVGAEAWDVSMSASGTNIEINISTGTAGNYFWRHKTLSTTV